MQIHEHIAHHVRKHKERIVAHVKRHHSKYLVWAWIVWWIATYKIIWAIIMFFGMSYMSSWAIGANYYDTEYYAQEEAKQISIKTNAWCNILITGDALSWWNNSPINN
jgi:hypothetical protein